MSLKLVCNFNFGCLEDMLRVFGSKHHLPFDMGGGNEPGMHRPTECGAI